MDCSCIVTLSCGWPGAVQVSVLVFGLENGKHESLLPRLPHILILLISILLNFNVLSHLVAVTGHHVCHINRQQKPPLVVFKESSNEPETHG